MSSHVRAIDRGGQDGSETRRVGRAGEDRRRARLVEGVVRSLVDKIVSGDYPAGQMLPSEPVLCETYEVSRTVVREAVKIVEHKHLVSVVQGRGSTVLPSDAWNVLDPSIIARQLEHDPSGRVYEELMLVRIALESEMSAEAASRLTPELEGELRAAIDGSIAHRGDPDALAEFDYRFHRLITDASGNRIGRGIMASLEDPLRASFRLAHRVPHETGAGEYHEPIFDAIASGDPDLARQTMHEHLSRTWQDLRDNLGHQRSAPSSGAGVTE